MKTKLIRITTVPISLKILLKGQLNYMNQYFDLIAVSSNGDDLKEVAREQGVKTKAIEMSRQITPIKDVVSLYKMVLFFLREKPQIVHTHTPKAGIVGMVAAWICRVPHRLHTVAGLPVMEAVGNKKKILLLVEKLTYFCATKVYINSYGLQDYILENRLASKDKLKIIGYGSSNGIDTNHFDRTDEVVSQSEEIEEKYNLKNKFVFCFVGRVVKDKGINELLYAFNRLSNEYDDIRLFVVGNFEEELNPISGKSKDILKNNEHIIEVGFQDDVRPYMACNNVFVLPTYREGFPNVVLQACSIGLPCIVTDINGCNEIIANEKNGLLVKVKKKDLLFDAMQRFLKDISLADKLSINSRKGIIKRYNRKMFFEFLLNEYNEVLKDDRH